MYLGKSPSSPIVCPSKGAVVGRSNILQEQHQCLKEMGSTSLRKWKTTPKATHQETSEIFSLVDRGKNNSLGFLAAFKSNDMLAADGLLSSMQ